MSNIADLPVADSTKPYYQVVFQNNTDKKVLSRFLSTIPDQLKPVEIQVTPASAYVYQTASFSPAVYDGAVMYAWDFGDGGVGSGRSVGHKFFTKGTFPVTLTGTLNGLLTKTQVNYIVNSQSTIAYDVGTQTEQLAGSNKTNALFSQGTTRNANIWTGAVDWTCRGYNGNFTLITANHAIYAAHYGTPDVCQFVDNNGNVISATVASRANVTGTDISIATFSAPVSSVIKPVKLLPVALAKYYSFNNEIFIPAIVLPANTNYSAQTMMYVNDSIFATDATQNDVFHNWPNSRQRQYGPYSGDSGSPLFLLTSAGPLLITSLYVAIAGPSYIQYRAQIEAITGTLPSPDFSSYPMLYP